MRTFLLPAIALLLSFPALAQDPPVPPPSVEEVAKAERLCKDLYEEDYLKTDRAGRRALARQLAVGASRTTDLPLKFVHLRDSARIAAEAGDSAAALAAIADMATVFAIDRWQLSMEHLTESRGEATSDQDKRDLATQFTQLAGAALAHERFDVCDRAVDAAQAISATAKDHGGQLARLAKLRHEIATLSQEWQAARNALKSKPEDRGAHAAVGKLVCALRGDWPAGLAHFTKSGEPSLVTIAAKEADAPTTPRERFELGNEWWELAEVQQGRLRDAFLARATFWYEPAIPDLDPVEAAIAEKRLSTVQEAATASVQPPKPEPAAAATVPPLGKELLVNGGAEQAMENGELPGWSQVRGNWHYGNPGTSPSTGKGYFSSSNLPGSRRRGLELTELSQTVDLTPYAALVAQGRITARLSFEVTTHHLESNDKGVVILRFFDADGQQLADGYTSDPQLSHGKWLDVRAECKVPAGARSARVILQSHRHAKRGQTSNDAHFDNVSLKFKRS